MDPKGEDVSKPIKHLSQAKLSSVSSSPVMDAANHKAPTLVHDPDAEPTILQATLAPNDLTRKIV